MGYGDLCSYSGCAGDRFAEWTFKGLTPGGVTVYWNELQEHLSDELDLRLKLHGFERKGGGAGGSRAATEAEAQDEMGDPLKDFPEDVEHDAFSVSEVAQARRDTEKVEKTVPLEDLTPEQLAELWPKERVAAYRGDDVLARRCSLNGSLWVAFCRIRAYREEQGLPPPSAEDMKQYVMRDIQIARLMPTDYELNRSSRESVASFEKSGRTVLPSFAVKRLLESIKSNTIGLETDGLPSTLAAMKAGSHDR